MSAPSTTDEIEASAAMPGSVRLAEWYNSMCDGEWEHGGGIKIETIDNPGWWVEIDISETPLCHLRSKRKNLTCEYEAADGKLIGVTCNPLGLDALLNYLADVLTKTKHDTMI